MRIWQAERLRISGLASHKTGWLSANKISLNVAKTKNFTFYRNVHKQIKHNLQLSINNIPLKLSESVKYLGVTLDHFLNWKINTNNLCSKLSSANGIIIIIYYYY